MVIPWPAGGKGDMKIKDERYPTMTLEEFADRYDLITPSEVLHEN